MNKGIKLPENVTHHVSYTKAKTKSLAIINTDILYALIESYKRACKKDTLENIVEDLTTTLRNQPEMESVIDCCLDFVEMQTIINEDFDNFAITTSNEDHLIDF
jgi:hypothetical protein